MLGAKTRGFSGRNLLCNLTKLVFEFIKSASCGGHAVSEDVVSKNFGFSGVDKAQADDAARGPPDVSTLKLLWVRSHWVLSLWQKAGHGIPAARYGSKCANDKGAPDCRVTGGGAPDWLFVPLLGCTT